MASEGFFYTLKVTESSEIEYSAMCLYNYISSRLKNNYKIHIVYSFRNLGNSKARSVSQKPDTRIKEVSGSLLNFLMILEHTRLIRPAITKMMEA